MPSRELTSLRRRRGDGDRRPSAASPPAPARARRTPRLPAGCAAARNRRTANAAPIRTRCVPPRRVRSGDSFSPSAAAPPSPARQSPTPTTRGRHRSENRCSSRPARPGACPALRRSRSRQAVTRRDSLRVRPAIQEHRVGIAPTVELDRGARAHGIERDRERSDRREIGAIVALAPVLDEGDVGMGDGGRAGSSWWPGIPDECSRRAYRGSILCAFQLSRKRRLPFADRMTSYLERAEHALERALPDAGPAAATPARGHALRGAWRRQAPAAASGLRHGRGPAGGSGPPRRARRGHRADARLLADSRRPAGHGRRRLPPRPARHPPGIRRGDRHPRRRRAAAARLRGAGHGTCAGRRTGSANPAGGAAQRGLRPEWHRRRPGHGPGRREAAARSGRARAHVPPEDGPAPARKRAVGRVLRGRCQHGAPAPAGDLRRRDGHRLPDPGRHPRLHGARRMATARTRSRPRPPTPRSSASSAPTHGPTHCLPAPWSRSATLATRRMACGGWRATPCCAASRGT